MAEFDFSAALNLLTTIAAVAAAVASYTARRHVRQLHDQINSRMDLLLVKTTEAATATGRQVERDANATAAAADKIAAAADKIERDAQKDK